MIPGPFKRMPALRALNVAGVGTALAAMTGALFAIILQHSNQSEGAITAIPTLVIGTVWAAFLRSKTTVTGRHIRLGWVLSLPLAATNAAIASAVYFAVDEGYANIFVSGALGATFGAIFWFPALILTLLCFGLPIARAQTLAKKGLAGEERGEWMVGLASFTISALALVIASQRTIKTSSGPLDAGRFILGLAELGMMLGGVAATLALARESRRRRFVKAASEGKVEGYRVDPAPEGKVLVRVGPKGQGYRVADFEEDVYELSEEGEATRPATMVMEDAE